MERSGSERVRDDAATSGRTRTVGRADDRARPRVEPFARLASDIASVLARDGLHAALGVLNARVRYRYTGIYRFATPVLRTVDLFDRENPSLRFAGCDRAIRDTYCGIVRTSKRPFTTADVTADVSLRGHAARATALSYLGVPLRSRGGALGGTLCHFDPRPRLAPEEEVEALERLAPLFAPWMSERSADR